MRGCKKSENSRSEKYVTRLTPEERKRLDMVAAFYQVNKSDLLRNFIANEYRMHFLKEKSLHGIAYPMISYICDGHGCRKDCGSTLYGPCRRTFDIKHAKNFENLQNQIYAEKGEYDE